jgi:GH15 family glucan-1,4-alpha-glucosidase
VTRSAAALAHQRLRRDGYAAIEDYAAIGDGRTVALVASDGSIDWLPVPGIVDPPVFGALLDPARSGRFALAPVGDYEVERSYVEDTNVLRTTYRTDGGEVTVTDALTTQHGGLLPWIELARRIDGTEGEVEFEWRVEPRFEHGLTETTIEPRRDGFLPSCRNRYLLLRSWDAGEVEQSAGAVGGRFSLSRSGSALLVAVMADREPIPFPPRAEVEARIEGTIAAWRRWADGCYDGDWRDAVVRSALALKLLIQAPTGAIAAAATTSLPERIGGDRNYDYRYAWIRDSAFALDALGRLGFREQVHGSLSWLVKASWGTHPRMQPFYELAGGVSRGYDELELAGYRGSRPATRSTARPASASPRSPSGSTTGSSATAGPRQSAATRSSRGRTTSTRPCCWRPGTATATASSSGSTRRSTRYGASSARGRSSTATPGRSTSKAPSSRARSGSRARWCAAAAATRRGR